ncbi:MAG TPA: hypothetical protein VJA47_02760 [archaeon]|nr:hypothetical protein [archaeon]
MPKPTLYVVRTNYDWPTNVTERFAEVPDTAEQELVEELGEIPTFDILGDAFDRFGGEELETGIQAHHQGSIYPNLELTEGGIVVHINRPVYPIPGYGLSIADNITYELLRDIILIRYTPVADRFITDRLPEGFTYFDLLFDFISNKGHYKDILAQLREDFDVRELEVMRPRFGR